MPGILGAWEQAKPDAASATATQAAMGCVDMGAYNDSRRLRCKVRVTDRRSPTGAAIPMDTVQSLKDSGLKATLPRRKILELFETSKVRHLSAEDVYRALITEGIDVGLATVYRVLTQFEQAGLLSRQNFEA